MKKSIILALAILPFTGLSMTCLDDYPIFKSSITVTVDKTEARIGDTVTATVVWKNENEGSDFEVELPNWIVNKGGKSVKDILYAVFTTQEDFNWLDEVKSYDNTPVKRPKILLKKDAVIKKEFKHTITEPEDLEVHTSAFYLFGWDEVYNPADISYYGFHGLPKSEKIKVQIKEQ